jgi:hypothetical protein
LFSRGIGKGDKGHLNTSGITDLKNVSYCPNLGSGLILQLLRGCRLTGLQFKASWGKKVSSFHLNEEARCGSAAHLLKNDRILRAYYVPDTFSNDFSHFF